VKAAACNGLHNFQKAEKAAERNFPIAWGPLKGQAIGVRSSGARGHEPTDWDRTGKLRDAQQRLETPSILQPNTTLKANKTQNHDRGHSFNYHGLNTRA